METLKRLEHTVNGNTFALFKAELDSLVKLGLSADAIVSRLWVSFRCFRIRDLERIVNEAIADRESSKLNNKTAKNDTMKTYRIKHNVGRAKYLVSYHNGEKFYQDGSAFFDLAIFNNKRKLDKFVKELIKQGYSE